MKLCFTPCFATHTLVIFLTHSLPLDLDEVQPTRAPTLTSKSIGSCNASKNLQGVVMAQTRLYQLPRATVASHRSS